METIKRFEQLCEEIRCIYKSLHKDGKTEEKEKFAKDVVEIIIDTLPSGITEQIK